MDIGKPQRVIIVEPLRGDTPIEVTAEREPSPSEQKKAAPSRALASGTATYSVSGR